MDRPETFTHVISSEQIGYSSELVQQAIFKPKQWRRPHDSSLREDTSYYGLAPRLLRVSMISCSG